MPTQKAAKYLQALQESLDAGRYSQIPELSRKVRKHDETRTCYARCAEVQASLLARLERAQQALDDANFNGVANRFQWLAVQDIELKEEKAWLDEGYAAASNATAEDREYFDVTNMFYGIVIRQMSASNALGPKMPSDPQSPNGLQGIALLGILHELEGRSSEAIAVYQRSHSASSSRASPASHVWLEHSLYRLAVLLPSDQTYNAFLKLAAGDRPPRSSRMVHVLSTQPQSAEYQKELIKSTHFPSADHTNIKLLDYVSTIVDPWINQGLDALRAEQMLVLLYDAASKTFHSPRLLRYLVYALSALERHDEALLALNAYLQVAIHALKTSPGADVDSSGAIVSVMQFAISHTCYTAPREWQGHLHSRDICARLEQIPSDSYTDDLNTTATIEEIRGISELSYYEALPEEQTLASALSHLEVATESRSNMRRLLDLTVAYAYSSQLSKAMACIRSALVLEPEDYLALLIFANLLTCEELLDRALIVLAKIVSSGPSTSPGWLRKRYVYMARLMEMKIFEISEGPAKALQHSSIVFVSFAECFGASQTTKNSNTDRTNDLHVERGALFARQVPVINEPARTNGSMSAAPLSKQRSRSLENRSNSDSRLGPDDDSHSLRKNIRSASLKLSHPHLHLPHHLHLRKSASVRSMQRAQTPIEAGSSRSSSPINHNTVPVSTFLVPAPEEDRHYEESVLQLTAAELQRRERDKLLAELWLEVAQISMCVGTLIGDAQQAIVEARQLIGQTPEVLVASLECRLQAADHALLSEHDIRAIEEGYEYALDLDDVNEKTIISFARFLTDDTHRHNLGNVAQKGPDASRAGRLARAYELIESIKPTSAGFSQQLWQISAQIAMERGEEDRAEEEYWKVVELSDSTGVLPWSKFRMHY